MDHQAEADAMAQIVSIVGEACSRAGVRTPVVRFDARPGVAWLAHGDLLVPHRAVAHLERHGRVPTDIARDIALTVAKRAGSDEIDALLFAEAFVRDRVLNA